MDDGGDGAMPLFGDGLAIDGGVRSDRPPPVHGDGHEAEPVVGSGVAVDVADSERDGVGDGVEPALHVPPGNVAGDPPLDLDVRVEADGSGPAAPVGAVRAHGDEHTGQPEPPSTDTSGDDGFSPFGLNLFGEPIQQHTTGLHGEFTTPPFSVLNAGLGPWQARKRAWLSYGIRSEIGRDARTFNFKEWATEKDVTGSEFDDRSIFDPVLTELMYRWFAPPGGHVVDPFAGGSVRGVVAHLLGYRYTGVELRSEQVDANREQGATITPGNAPTWIAGDSLDVLPDVPTADMVLTCPPYFDLEKYSDHARDLSAMTFERFTDAYRAIIAATVERMRPDSFAVFVIGDVRDKEGVYRDLPGATIRAFADAGAPLYNRGILVTVPGTLPVRVGQQFRKSRKLGMMHQDVLVFVRGDGRRAANRVTGS
jgi:hypothetical protein